MEYLGTVAEQMTWFIQHNVGTDAEVNLQDAEKASLEGVRDAVCTGMPPIRCCNDCEALYCSEKCRVAAWNDHHNLLCPKQEDEFACQWLEDFNEHASNTNDIFILAAQTMAKLFNNVDQCVTGNMGVPLVDAVRQALNPLRMAHKGLWWESVGLPDDVDDEEQFRAGMSC